MALGLKGRLSWSLAVASLASPLGAATVAPPANLGELARLSRSVVLARAVGSRPDEARSGLPSTITRFERVRHVAGEALPETFAVSEAGGIRDGRGVAVGGSPAYETGRTYLLFLDRLGDGRLRSRMMAYGLLVEDERTGLLVPLEEAGDIDTLAGSVFEPVTAYDAALLLDHLAEVARGATWSRERAGSIPVERVAAAARGLRLPPVRRRPAGALVRVRDRIVERADPPHHAGPGGHRGRRRRRGDAGHRRLDQPPRLDHPLQLRRQRAPPPSTAPIGEEQGAVWFNDPCSAIPDLRGLLGHAGLWRRLLLARHLEPRRRALAPGWPRPSWWSTTATQCIGDVNFREMMTHELGHTQGFGHHAVAPPPNNPTMSAQLKADGRGAALVGLDRTCASYTYHTFLDVPFANPAWRFVEAVENAGVDRRLRRRQLLPQLRGRRGSRWRRSCSWPARAPPTAPPACTTPPFTDVP